MPAASSPLPSQATIRNVSTTRSTIAIERRSTSSSRRRLRVAATRWAPLSRLGRMGRGVGHDGSRLWPPGRLARAAPLRTEGWQGRAGTRRYGLPCAGGRRWRDRRASAYPHLFSEWQIRNTTIANRVVFAPTCPTWVADPYEGVFTDQAVAYYEERAKGGCGLIIIGGTIIHPERAVLAVQLPGALGRRAGRGARARRRRGAPARLQARVPAPARRAARHAGAQEGPGLRLRRGVVHGRAEPGPARRVPERADAEGARGARDRGDPRRVRGRGAARDRGRPRRRRVPHVARLPAVAVPLAALQPPHRPLGRLVREPPALPGRGDDARSARRSATTPSSATGSTRPRSGRATSSSRTSSGSSPTSSGESDVDYVNVSAGVHHSYIHTPMTYEPGWERGYTQRGQAGLVEAGAARRPDHPARRRRGAARRRRGRRDPARAPAVRRRRVGAQGARGPRGRHPPLRRRELLLAQRDPRRPRAVRLQPGGRARAAVGRRARSTAAADAKRVLVVGAGPAGLEYARIAAARGHEVVVLEREAEVGGHVRSHSLLPGRTEYGQIGRWLARQARGNGAEIRTASTSTTAGLDALLAAERPTTSSSPPARATRADGCQGQTAAPLPGRETGRCVAWDEVATGKARADRQGARDRRPAGRRRAAHRGQARRGRAAPSASSPAGRWSAWRRSPRSTSSGSAAALRAGRRDDRPTTSSSRSTARRSTLLNVYQPDRELDVDADWIVMATGRQSENGLYHALRERGRERRDDRRRGRAARDLRGRLRGPPPGAQAVGLAGRCVTTPASRLLAVVGGVRNARRPCTSPRNESASSSACSSSS